MNRKNNSGSGIFLMEMMMAVCFFILCASTCIWAFAKADHASRLAADRNQAVNAAESAAEVWKLSGIDGLEQEMNAEVLTEEDGHSLLKLCWDENWELLPTDRRDEARYFAVVEEMLNQGGMGSVLISVERSREHEEALFVLEAKNYEPGAEDR